MKKKITNFQISIFNTTISPKAIVTHPLFAGSAVMILGSNVANFFAYIYHLVIGRMLGPVEYGELAASITFISMLITSFSFISVVVIKFISSSNDKDQRTIIGWFSKYSLYVGGLITVLLFIAAPVFADFFHIHRSIMYIIAPIVGISVVSMVLKSFLQGLLLFGVNVLATNIEMIGRLLLALICVYLGYGVFGALVGLLVAIFFEIIFVLSYLRKYTLFRQTGKFSAKKKVFVYAIPILLSTVATNSLISTDVLLVKHYFDPFDAGLYASLSNLGKIIFFGTAPIGSVMFPLIAKRHARGENHKKIFLVSILLTFSICAGVTSIYFLFPEFMISVLYGDKFIAASSQLYLFGIFISIYTLGSLLLSYYLSHDKTKTVGVAIFAALVQYALITIYHDSLSQVIMMSIISALILLGGLGIYYAYGQFKKK